MILTEEEAKTKWCPFARLSIGKDLAAPNRGPSVEEKCRCIGSACMAWRRERTTPRDIQSFLVPGDWDFTPPMAEKAAAQAMAEGYVASGINTSIHGQPKLWVRLASIDDHPRGFCGLAERQP
jgi:hypothetical protein